MDLDELQLDLEVKMESALENYQKNLRTVRTGRASASMFERVLIDYYGEMTPINQIANISVPEARQIVIKPYERDFLKAIEKAITDANLGLTPTNDGMLIRITVPALTEDRRREYVRMASKMAEDAKIVIRNVRREGNDKVKGDKTIPEDLRKGAEEDIQKLTDKFIKKIDELYEEKEKDIMTI